MTLAAENSVLKDSDDVASALTGDSRSWTDPKPALVRPSNFRASSFGASKVQEQEKVSENNLGDWIEQIQQTCSRGTRHTLAFLGPADERGAAESVLRKLEPAVAIGPAALSQAQRRKAGGHRPRVGRIGCEQLFASADGLKHSILFGADGPSGGGKVDSDGAIHPALTQRQAKALLAEHLPATQRETPGSKLKARLARFAMFIRSDGKNWSPAEREWASHQLAILAGVVRISAKLVKSTGTRITRLNSRPFKEWADTPDVVAWTT